MSDVASVAPATRPAAQTAPPLRARLAAALAVGALCAALSARAPLAVTRPDFGVTRRAVRAFVTGSDPYAAVGPAGRRVGADFPLLYPMPAVLVQAPLAPLADRTAQVLFVGLSAAAAAFGLTRKGWPPLLAFASPCALVALLLAHWSFALAAAATVAPLAWLVAVKPNVGLAVAATWQSRRQWLWGIAGTAALLALSFALVPAWFGEWRAAVSTASHVRAPVTSSVGGAVLAAGALLRWRRPEARLLLALALVPHTPAYYDALLLFLVVATPGESIALVVLGWVANLAEPLLMSSGATFAAEASVRGTLVLALLYLPCLLMVLRRPNEGPVPRWAERAVAATARAWRVRFARARRGGAVA